MVIEPPRMLSNGRIAGASFAFSGEHWDEGEFADMITDLHAVYPRSARTHFLGFKANPGDVD